MNTSSSCLAAKAIKILQHVSNANELVKYFFQNKCYFTEVHLTLMQLNQASTSGKSLIHVDLENNATLEYIFSHFQTKF